MNEEASTLVDELNGIGLNISSIWDLVNTRKKYPRAISILLKHLVKDYSEKNKEGIVRALTVKEAIGKATPTLIDEYMKLSKDQTILRWTIGNAIFKTITKHDVDRIIPIIKDKENGISRQMFVAALGKVNLQNVENVLIDLLDDDEVVVQAIKALGQLKSLKAREKIVVLSKHSNKLIKTEAENALKVL
ncbi:hypothetical protein A9996_11975 [Gelidibacter algens]|nr:hypothetical protein A9996_11975 [Gelidibacter algens]